MQTKKCTRCEDEKSVTEFHLLKNGLYGRHSNCKTCRSEIRKGSQYDRQESGTKLCPKCDQKLDVIQFHSDKTSTNGLQTYCKKCNRINNAKWVSTYDGYITKLYKDLRNNAKRRKIGVHITKDDIMTLYKQQNGLCKYSNKKMTYKMDPDAKRGNRYLTNVSVDRIDSTKPYTKDNIQLVCGIVNTIKWDLPEEAFLSYCKDIYLTSLENTTN